jgi:hypothetical protein
MEEKWKKDNIQCRETRELYIKSLNEQKNLENLKEKFKSLKEKEIVNNQELKRLKAVDFDNKSLREINENNEVTILRLTEETHRYKEAISEVRKELQNVNYDLKEEIEQAKNENAVIQGKLNLIKAQFENYKEESDTLKSKLESDLKTKTEELNYYENEMFNKDSKDIELSRIKHRLEMEIDHKTKECEQLKSEIVQIKQIANTTNESHAKHQDELFAKMRETEKTCSNYLKQLTEQKLCSNQLEQQNKLLIKQQEQLDNQIKLLKEANHKELKNTTDLTCQLEECELNSKLQSENYERSINQLKNDSLKIEKNLQTQLDELNVKMSQQLEQFNQKVNDMELKEKYYIRELEDTKIMCEKKLNEAKQKTENADEEIERIKRNFKHEKIKLSNKFYEESVKCADEMKESHNKSLEETRAKYESKQGDEVQKFENQLNQIQSQIENKNSEIERIKADHLKSIEKLNSDYEQACDSMNEQFSIKFEEVNATLAATNEQLSQMKLLNKQKEEEIITLTTKYEVEKNELMKDLKTNFDSSIEKLKADQLLKMQQKDEEIENLKSNKDKQIEEYQNQMKQNEFENKKEYSDLLNNFNSINEKLSETCRVNCELEEEIQILNTQINDKNEKIQQFERKMKQNTESELKLNEKINQFIKSNEELEEQIEVQLNKHSNILEDYKKQFKDDIEFCKINYESQLEKSKVAMNEEREQLKLNFQNELKDKLDQTKAEFDIKIAELQRINDEKTVQCNRYEKDINDAQAEFNSMKQQLQNAIKETKHYKTKLAEHEKTFKNYEELLNSKNNEINSLTMSLEKSNHNSIVLEKQIANIANIFSEYEFITSAFRAEKELKEQLERRLVEEATKKKAEIDSLRNDCANLEHQLKDKNNLLTQAENNYTKLQNGFQAKTKALEEAQKLLVSADNDIKSIQSEKRTLQNELEICKKYGLNMDEHYQKRKKVFEQAQNENEKLQRLLLQKEMHERSLVDEIAFYKQKLKNETVNITDTDSQTQFKSASSIKSFNSNETVDRRFSADSFNLQQQNQMRKRNSMNIGAAVGGFNRFYAISESESEAPTNEQKSTMDLNSTTTDRERLSILQARNTQTKPHLRSSYALEVSTVQGSIDGNSMIVDKENINNLKRSIKDTEFQINSTKKMSSNQNK